MSEEIKEILDGFEEILDNPTTTDECYDGRIIEVDRSYDLDLDEIKLLLDYITNLQENYERIYNENCKLMKKHNITDINLLDENYILQEENKRLKEDYVLLQNASDEVEDKLNNNWNKLEEYIRSYINLLVKNPDMIEQGQLDILYEILDKMKEIKEKNND